MASQAQRRNRRRHTVNWKAAIAFAAASGKPVVYTQTQDLSASGAAVLSDHDDLMGATVTILLAAPAGDGGNAQRMLKLPARVVSSVRTPGMSQYRHGLEFIRSVGDGLNDLEAMLQDLQDAAPRMMDETAPAPAPPAPNRLEALRQLAQLRLAAQQESAPQIPIQERIDDALQRTYAYLKDLADQLNVVKPEFPKGYVLAGVPDFRGLAWASGHANFHTRAVAYGVKHYERVILQFLLSADKSVRVDREYPASEKLQRVLTDCRIEFAVTEVRNARGSVQHMTFDFPCKVAANILFSADVEAGKILLHTSNVSGFGVVQQVLSPDAITAESLNEFSAFILGETKALGPLLLRGA
jgi:hypothetical protein